MCETHEHMNPKSIPKVGMEKNGMTTLNSYETEQQN